MANTFPGAVNDFTEIPAGTKQGAAIGGRTHRQFINDMAAAIEADETKLGESESSAQDSPIANTILGSLTDGNSKWMQVIAAQIAAGATMKQLAKTTLLSDTANIDFTSISQSYSTLMIDVQARSSTNAAIDSCVMRLGAAGSLDTGNNYDNQRVFGSLSTAGADEAFAQSSLVVTTVAADTATAGEASFVRIILPNYTGTTFRKKVLANYAHKHGQTTGTMVTAQYGGTWRNTAAIDTIRIFCAGNFRAGSVFTLWGLP